MKYDIIFIIVYSQDGVKAFTFSFCGKKRRRLDSMPAVTIYGQVGSMLQ